MFFVQFVRLPPGASDGYRYRVVFRVPPQQPQPPCVVPAAPLYSFSPFSDTGRRLLACYLPTAAAGASLYGGADACAEQRVAGYASIASG